MNPVAICCWASLIVCLISIGMMIYGETEENYFYKLFLFVEVRIPVSSNHLYKDCEISTFLIEFNNSCFVMCDLLAKQAQSSDSTILRI